MRSSALRRLLATCTLAVCMPFGAQLTAQPPKPVHATENLPPPTLPHVDPVLERALREWPDGHISTMAHPGEWSYEEGVLLDGMVAQWRATADARLFAYVHAAVDRSVDADGAIHLDGGAGFPSGAHSLDDLEMGRSVLVLYRVLQQPRYYQAAKFLHEQAAQQPRNRLGGYWHKGMYPNQMWLDGAYMAEPFLANYARTFQHASEMDGVAEQLLLMSAHMRDRHDNLLRHGWDASREQAWADKSNGQSPEVWARGMGWFVMALVDVLDRMPAIDPQRAAIEELTQRTLTAVARFQDPISGLWWQVMDKGGAHGNYFESSASCMFVYAMARAIREGVLPLAFEDNVTRGWNGIQAHFVKPDGTLTGTVKSVGLGGSPYRAGTYDYYTSEPVVDNDAKGVGAYLLALSEMTVRAQAGDLMRRARGKTVMFDAWFNSQTRRNADGGTELFHYKPNDDANSGYSWLNRMFLQYGMRSDTLDHAPTAADLKGSAVYVIASPDHAAVNATPHFMDAASADVIEAWVKAGGVLLMMENDSGHADQTHFDVLADRFGIHFNPVTVNKQLGDSYANTLVPIPAGTGGIFQQAHTALMKETCTLSVSGAARPLLTSTDAESRADPKGTASAPDGAYTVMAESRAGKGTVFANVDPWVYNEYTDGRTLPLGEDNFAGGQELVRWVVGLASR